MFLCFRGWFFPSLIWHPGFPWPSIDWPAPRRFGRGGALDLSGFAALLVGLSTYTAAFIGKSSVVASSIDKGQREAASPSACRRCKCCGSSLLLQALRVVIPPTTSQFLNLTKNSSLAVAIGYPDLISITNTTLNQTGQAIEAIACDGARISR